MRMSKALKIITAIAMISVVLTISSVFSLFTSTVIITNSGNIIAAVNRMAASGSARDIQAAVDWVVAHGGVGNVTIPAGTFNFFEAGDTWKPVFVPIGVNIIGASPTGSDSLGIPTGWTTIIKQGIYVSGNESGGIQAWFQLGRSYANEYFSWNDSSEPKIGPVDPSRWVKPIRFANIMLDGWRTDYPLSGAETIGLVITGVINFRVDHCNFKNIAGGAIIINAYYQSGDHCCGVIDHNKIWNTNGISNNANYILGNVGYGIAVSREIYPGALPYDSTTDLLGKYFSYAVYIENNYFSRWRHDISSGHGSWYVARYNLFEHDFDGVTVDMHGERDVGDYAGSRGGEVYENIFLNCTYYGDNNDQSMDLKAMFCVRGGSGVFFNNYADSTYKRVFMDEYDAVHNEVWKMKDWFVWSAKGTTPELAVIANYNPFTYDPANNNHLDWARQAGTPSDVNYPNVDPSWSIAGYKPYTYPHPLTLGLEP